MRSLLLGLFVLVACAQSPSVVSQTCEKTVTIANFAFNPTPITIKKGGCVTFVNTDFTTHSVNVDTGNSSAEVGTAIFDLSPRDSKDSPALSETLNYICRFHPNSMKGTITVQ